MHCNVKGYTALLNPEDQFGSITTLSEMTWSVMDRGIMGTFVSLQFEGKKIETRKDVTMFHRGQEGIVNPNKPKLNYILNHLRVFSIEAFRYIPQHQHRDMYGQYFEDRTIFLMTLLEMIRTEIT